MLLIVLLHGNASKLNNQTGDYYRNPDNFSKAVPVSKGGTGMTSIATQKINCTVAAGITNTTAYIMYSPLTRQCTLFLDSSNMYKNNVTVVAVVPANYRSKQYVSTAFGEGTDEGKISVDTNGNIKVTISDNNLPSVFVNGQILWFI